MKHTELSIFVDESGDYGQFGNDIIDFSDKFYIICLVFHEQNKSINKQIEFLNNKLTQRNFNYSMIHCGPLIRKEYPFKNYKSENIQALLYDLICFVKNIDISYFPIIVDKSLCKSREDIEYQLLISINDLINANYLYLTSFYLNYARRLPLLKW
ncbi:MAG: hypothetical protein RSC93_11020 [Erysipelotrichaceae bacterium]